MRPAAPGSRTASWRRIALILTVLGAGAQGCLAIAGNFDIVDTDGGLDASSPDVAADLDAATRQDSTTPVEAEGAGEETSQVPATDASDGSDGADAAMCGTGQVQCAGSELQICNPAHDGWVNRELCGSPPLCGREGGACTPVTCQKNDKQCDGANLQICNADEDGWSTMTTCVSASHCDAKNGVCTAAPCTTGNLQCSGVNLQTCVGPDTGWMTTKICVTTALCNADAGVCEAAVCLPGQYRCNGAELDVCNAGLSGWVATQTCTNASLCVALAGQCVPPTCMPNEYRCSGSGASDLQRHADRVEHAAHLRHGGSVQHHAEDMRRLLGGPVSMQWLDAPELRRGESGRGRTHRRARRRASAIPAPARATRRSAPWASFSAAAPRFNSATPSARASIRSRRARRAPCATPLQGSAVHPSARPVNISATPPAPCRSAMLG